MRACMHAWHRVIAARARLGGALVLHAPNTLRRWPGTDLAVAGHGHECPRAHVLVGCVRSRMRSLHVKTAVRAYSCMRMLEGGIGRVWPGIVSISLPRSLALCLCLSPSPSLSFPDLLPPSLSLSLPPCVCAIVLIPENGAGRSSSNSGKLGAGGNSIRFAGPSPHGMLPATTRTRARTHACTRVLRLRMCVRTYAHPHVCKRARMNAESHAVKRCVCVCVCVCVFAG